MSNVFTSEKIAIDYLNLLKKPHPGSTLTVNTVGASAKADAQAISAYMEPETSDRKLTQEINKSSVRSFLPKVIGKDEVVDLTALAPPNVVACLEMAGNSDSLAEVHVQSTENRHVPIYKPPKILITDPDYGILNLLQHAAFNMVNNDVSISPIDERDVVLTKILTMAHDVSVNMRYGVGSTLGQIKRLAVLTDVHDGTGKYHKNKELRQIFAKEKKFTLQFFVEKVLHEVFNISPYDPQDFEINRSPPPIRPPVDWFPTPQLAKEKPNFQFLPSVKDTSAGLPYPSTKKKSVYLSAVLESNNLLTKISSIIKESMDAKKRKQSSLLTEKLTELLSNEYWYLSCSYLVPKDDRYPASVWMSDRRTEELGIEKKYTRNISSASIISNLTLGYVSKGPMRRCTNYLNSKSPSLYKCNFLQGGMNRFISKILHEKDDICLVYSDNLYFVYDDGLFSSVDLTKGEANATKSATAALGYYLLTQGWTSRSGQPFYNSTYAAVATLVAPAITIDGTALLEKYQMLNPGQSSGNQLTFQINHVSSAIIRYFWNKLKKPRPTAKNKKFFEIQEITGIDFKIEYETSSFKKDLIDLRTNNMDSYENYNVVKADLLGYDIAFLPDYGYVPVLALDRLITAFMVPRPVELKFKNAKIVQYIKYITLYTYLIMGGWAYKILRETMLMRCDSYYANLAETTEAQQLLLLKFVTEEALVKDLNVFPSFQKLIVDREMIHRGYLADRKKFFLGQEFQDLPIRKVTLRDKPKSFRLSPLYNLTPNFKFDQNLDYLDKLKYNEELLDILDQVSRNEASDPENVKGYIANGANSRYIPYIPEPGTRKEFYDLDEDIPEFVIVKFLEDAKDYLRDNHWFSEFSEEMLDIVKTMSNDEFRVIQNAEVPTVKKKTQIEDLKALRNPFSVENTVKYENLTSEQKNKTVKRREQRKRAKRRQQ